MDQSQDLIQRFFQTLLSGIEPLFASGDLGYVAPIILLLVASLAALTTRQRSAAFVGYALGWGAAVLGIGFYQQIRGDLILEQVTGVIPRTDYFMPAFWGLALGFFILLPFSRLRPGEAAPVTVGVATAAAVLLLFVAWRASLSVPDPSTTGLVELIAYRKRYVGVFALAFGIGILVHVLLSATNPPRPPPKPG